MTTPNGHLAKQLGDALTADREAKGTSQRGLAGELGVAHTTLRELEAGLANPTLKRVEDVAAAYGLTVGLTVTPATVRAPRKGRAR